MKKIKSLSLIILFVLLLIIFWIFKFEWYCPIKKYLHICCPGCGLTRSILAILHLDLIGAISYNILGLPIVVIVSISCVFLMKDFIYNDDKYFKFMNNFFNKNWKIILIIIVVTMIINNVNGV